MSGRGGRGRGGGRGGGDHGGGRRGGGGEGHSERGRGRGRSGGEEVKQRMPQGGAPPPPTVSLSDLNRGVDCLHISTSTGSSSSAAPYASNISEVGSSSTTCATTALSVPLAAEEQNVLPTSTKGLNPPQRPGFGSVGVKCVVNANHFLVALKKPNMDLFHYDVSIVPEVTSRRVNRMVIEKLVKDYGQSYLGGLNPAYDGRKNIFTAGSLPFESKEFVIKLDNEGDSKRDREFKVAIRLAAKLDFYHLIAFLQRKQLDAPHELITLLDVVLRASPSIRHVSVGRSFFSCDFGDPSKLGGGVECWRGYYQSLRPTQMGLSLNIDLSATSFVEALPVINFIGANLGMRYSSKPMRDADRVKVRRALRGLKVVLTHLKDRQIKRRITGITSLPTKSLTFIGPEGLEKSVPQYFNEKYGIHLEYVEWPSLQTGNDSNPTYFPMEVCNIVSGQRYIKKLSDAQVREMLVLSCTPPRVRQENILKTVTGNGYQSDKFAREFGLDVSNRLTRVDARILPAPELMYHKMNGQLDVCSPKSGSWNMINRKAVNGGNCQSWACLNFSRNRDDVVWNFANSLADKCRNMGMGFSEEPLYFSRSPPDRCERALHDVLANCKKKLTDEKHLQLLLIVLPEASGLYGRIKRICETELGIVSQCCKPKQVHDCKPQYQENVALKINVKVGGRNTQIMKPMNLPMVTDLPTIIFGADVTHPHPGEDTIPSIAAVVASMDWPYVTNYRCLVSAQKHRDEIIHDLYVPPIDPSKSPGGMIRDHLLAFYVATRQKPSRIIFYRDGVSEGQFNAVLLHEMDAIRKACQTLEQGYLPRVTFVVVQKRHHTRLFPADKNVDRSGNILPGTVVDTTICHPTQFDFYLCSHAGIKGTSRPTHYHVLYDENRFSADHFQILTNNLCYTYARCTRSVSIVPPAYYAHLAAFRARYYMDDGSDALSTTDSGNKRGKEAVVRPIPKIMDIVNKVMFYC